MTHQRQPVLQVSRDSVESVAAIATTTADPTQAASQWAFLPVSDPKPSGKGSDGGWTAWNASTKKATAISPSLPASDSQYYLDKGTYNIWCKWTVGSERPWKRIGRLEVF